MRFGEPVTFWSIRGGAVKHGRAAYCGDTHILIESPDGSLHRRRLTDEGVQWIRGSHRQYSDEVKALRVAWSLMVNG